VSRHVDDDGEVAAMATTHRDATRLSTYEAYETDAGHFARSPAFTQHLGDSRAKELGRAHLEAKVVPQGDPNLRVEWLKDGRPLGKASRIQIFQVRHVPTHQRPCNRILARSR